MNRLRFLLSLLPASLVAQTRIGATQLQTTLPDAVQVRDVALFGTFSGGFTTPIVLGEGLQVSIATDSTGKQTLRLSALEVPTVQLPSVTVKATRVNDTSFTVPNDSALNGRFPMVFYNGIFLTPVEDYTLVKNTEISMKYPIPADPKTIVTFHYQEVK